MEQEVEQGRNVKSVRVRSAARLYVGPGHSRLGLVHELGKHSGR